MTPRPVRCMASTMRSMSSAVAVRKSAFKTSTPRASPDKARISIVRAATLSNGEAFRATLSVRRAADRAESFIATQFWNVAERRARTMAAAAVVERNVYDKATMSIAVSGETDAEADAFLKDKLCEQGLKGAPRSRVSPFHFI